MKPKIIIKNKNIRAKYYDDGSGYVEILNNSRQQIFCEESGTISSQIKRLENKIQNLKKELVLFNKGLQILKQNGKK